MKKLVLVVTVLISFAAIPGVASASGLTNFISWLVPTELKPVPAVETTTQGVGGIIITAEPVILSGDTSRTFYLPALTSRSFRIQNNGTVDLFLNKNNALAYVATPAVVPSDVPAAYALNVGIDRTIVITNPSTTSNVFLSKIDLGITSVGTSSVSQPSVFVNNAQAKSVIVNNGEHLPTIASLAFNFTLNNATNKDIFVSRLINPLSFVTMASVPGATTSIKFIESAVKTIAGDTSTIYAIPAGSSRPFELTGIIDNTHGEAGTKVLALTEMQYSTSKTLLPLQSLSGPVLLRNLTTTVNLGAGALPPIGSTTPALGTTTVPVKTVPPVTPTTPVIAPPPAVIPPPPVVIETASSTALLLIPPVLLGIDLTKPSVVIPPKVVVTATPSGSGSPTPTPSTSVTASPTASPSGTSNATNPNTTESPAATPEMTTASGGLFLSLATTTIGAPIVENEEVVGYPVTFAFTARATVKSAYISKTPGTVFTTVENGFGSVLPTINNLSAYPAVRTGDGGSYYVIPAETFRSFQAFALLKSDGLSKASTTQSFQIVKVNYGNRTTALTEGGTTTQNLKATVKLSPRTKPAVISTESPSGSPTPTPTDTASPSPTPTAANLIALCYAVPTNPYTGDIVTWQVMQTGGSGTPSYTWTGNEGLSGSSSQIQKRYANTGRKDALVSVVSGNQSVTATCNVTVTLQPSPSFTPSDSPTATPTNTASPTSTGSPSPTSSDSAMGTKKDRGFVANTLYAAGEWLDSLFAR